MTLTTDPPLPGRRGPDPLTAIAVICIVVAGVLLLFSQLAHAAGDPTPAPTTSDIAWSTLMQHGPWWLGVAMLHVALRMFLDRQHWLQQGRLLTGLTSLAGVSAAVVAWRWQGAPSVGILTAIIAGGALLLHPAPVAAKGSGSTLLTSIVLAVALLACTAAQRADLASDAKHAIINCTAQDLGTTPGLDLTTLAAIVNVAERERLKCTPPGGSLSWQCVEADLLREGETIGGCAFVRLVMGAAKPTGSALAATSAPPPGRAELERFRRDVAGGATFHTATGDL